MSLEKLIFSPHPSRKNLHHEEPTNRRSSKGISNQSEGLSNGHVIPLDNVASQSMTSMQTSIIAQSGTTGGEAAIGNGEVSTKADFDNVLPEKL